MVDTPFTEINSRYRYKYKDTNNIDKYVYSWKLDRHDRIPTGKTNELSLREKEITADLFNQIASHGGGMNVISLVEKYVSCKRGVRPSTEAAYRTVLNLLKKERFGSRRIDTVKVSDAKIWLINLQENGRGYSSIRTIRGVLRPAFQMALHDDLIKRNPFNFELQEVVYNDSIKRKALTKEQERRFLAFIKEDKHFSRYYEGIFILLNTGLRISEFVGLTINAIDFDHMKINIDHQLLRYAKIGYTIKQPKTESGIREIPMTKEIAECFKRIIENRLKPRVEPNIDGYKGFLYLDKDNKPMVAMHWGKYFQHIVEKYNSIYKTELPKITPHVCRHTFCSRMATARMNPKTLQYIMGHSDIAVTLNTYTHVTFDDVSIEMDRVNTINEERNQE